VGDSFQDDRKLDLLSSEFDMSLALSFRLNLWKVDIVLVLYFQFASLTLGYLLNIGGPRFLTHKYPSPAGRLETFGADPDFIVVIFHRGTPLR
jgi:hypothetical protein